ncbi:SOS response transcriptional repressor [Bradyrhizobium sp. AC87j1]|uniref:SOS response transcriptional repressor n=1 Tax=Bradyrhizobium sp. AC87j1 TaxID=2055894 RepID=UPI0032DE5E21
MSEKSGTRFTEKQGHYLAFIHTYSYMFGQPPAEADIQRHFRVSPPDDPHPRTKRLHSPLARCSPKHRDSPATRKLADPRMVGIKTSKSL